MGNVPFSCCKSKSPRLQQLSKKFGCGSASSNRQSDSKLSYSGDKKHSFEQNNVDTSSLPQSILQHISEREPDDSETDPSSNPTNQPIFAARSCPNPRIKRNSEQQQASPVSQPSPNLSNEQYLRAIRGSHFTCSQDHEYSTGSPTYNLINPLYSGKREDSFEKQQDSCKLNNLPKQLRRDSITMENGNETIQPDELSGYSSGNYLFRSNHRPYHERRFSEYVYAKAEALKPKIAKAASTSTIFIDSSTISQPCLELTIKCVSLAIYYHIKNRSSDNGTDIFDENKHPLKLPENEEFLRSYKDCEQFDDSDNETSDLSSKKAVYTFVKTLFTSAELTSEHAITTLVYLERLMTYTELDLAPTTWRRMFLGAILLSSKVWEDQAVWNVDYADILEGISVEDINELERRFLEFIQFNMNVPSSVYAKYYFHLRSLAFENNLTEARGLLTVGRAKTMEAMSRVVGTDPNASPVQRNTKPQKDIKRHASLERLRLTGNTRAVLM